MRDNSPLQWKDQPALTTRSIVAVASTPDGEYTVRQEQWEPPLYRLEFGVNLLLAAGAVKQCKERAQQHRIGFQRGNQIGKDFKRLVEDHLHGATVSLNADGSVRVSGESYTFSAEKVASDLLGVLGFLRTKFQVERRNT